MTPQPEAQAPDVRLANLTKRYGEVTAVGGIDLDVASGEFFTMLGPSGSGKTTTLRLIAGFERPDEGRIELAGADVSGLPPFERQVNTVFQDYALFPHMSVVENVEYGLRVRTSGSYFEASADLGADGWQTFRYVTLPAVRTALIAGGLLAFALSWDEIVVTYFTAGAQNTLPLLIFGKIRQGQELPVVNAIALFVIVLTIVPVFLAQRLTTGRDVERTAPVATGVA